MTSQATLNVSNQTEGFTITGSSENDTITGGSGADSISSGLGNDRIIWGGEIADTVLDGGIETTLWLLKQHSSQLVMRKFWVLKVSQLTRERS